MAGSSTIGALNVSLNVEAKEAITALNDLTEAAEAARQALGLLGITLATTADTFGEDFERTKESIQSGARTSKGRFSL